MTLIRLSRRSMLTLAAGLPLTLAVSGRAAAIGTLLRYTMTAFTNASQTSMNVYQSSDGTNFWLVRENAYRPPDANPNAPAAAPTDLQGLCRDPSLLRHPDGTYYVAYTTAWNGNTIGFAASSDLINWKFLYNYTIPIAGVQHTWAPDWFLDGNDVHILVNLNTGKGFQPHLMTATDVAQGRWSDPTPLIGIGPVAGNLGFIDTTIVRPAGRYYAFTKNETTKNIEVAVADAVVGPYSFERTGNWAGWGGAGTGEPREGQCLLALPDGRWRIYLDAYNLDHPDLGSYLYSDSVTPDLLGPWTAPAALPHWSGIIRHCTVVSDPQSPVNS